MTADVVVFALFGVTFTTLGVGSYVLRKHFDLFSLGVLITAGFVFATWSWVQAIAAAVSTAH